MDSKKPGRDRTSIVITAILFIIALMIIANALYFNTTTFGFCLIEDDTWANVSCIEYLPEQ